MGNTVAFDKSTTVTKGCNVSRPYILLYWSTELSLITSSIGHLVVYSVTNVRIFIICSMGEEIKTGIGVKISVIRVVSSAFFLPMYPRLIELLVHQRAVCSFSDTQLSA